MWNGPAPVGSTGRTQVLSSIMAAAKVFVAGLYVGACAQNHLHDSGAAMQLFAIDWSVSIVMLCRMVP